MTASTRRELRSAATSTSTTAIDLIRALTDARPIKPTSTRCLSARRPNPGRGSTYRRGNSVQTTAATSIKLLTFWPSAGTIKRAARTEVDRRGNAIKPGGFLNWRKALGYTQEEAGQKLGVDRS